MGVYIDMEMPTEGYIDVRIKCNGTASFAIADNPYFKAVEAVPIPPHGRLVDADRLLSEHMKKKYYHLPNGDTAIPIIDVEHAPTVIEAEEEKV